MTNDVRVGDVWKHRDGSWEIKIISPSSSTSFEGSKMWNYKYTNTSGDYTASQAAILGGGVLVSRASNKHIKHYFGEL